MEFSKENMLKMLEGKKKFFLKSFLISVAIFIVSVIILMMGYQTWSEMAYKFYGLDQQHYALLACGLMGLWEILIIQFTLVPFIALCMMEKYMKSKEGY